MKTLTEFTATTLANAAKAKQELIAAGKTPEELPAALGEALKVEGDKLSLLLSALDTLGEKAPKDLKRVVVLSLGEGEKAPAGSKQVEDKCFLIENYAMPSKGPQGAGPHDDKKGRGDKRGGGKGRGGGGRDDRRGGGGGGGDKRGAPGEGRPAANKSGLPPKLPQPLK
jgi:hypothetical protein